MSMYLHGRVGWGEEARPFDGMNMFSLSRTNHIITAQVYISTYMSGLGGSEIFFGGVFCLGAKRSDVDVRFARLDNAQ